MAFINDYLSDEEMEMFKKLNISYPSSTGKHGIIGYSSEAYVLEILRPTCTIDREEKIYFFYCGTERYDMENVPKQQYFYLLWNKELGDDIVTVILEKKYMDSNSEHLGDIVYWKMDNCYFKSNDKKLYDKIILKLKEALSAYGIIGNPDNKSERPRVDFDF